MKDVGVVRKLDSLGRIVVPVEMRKKLGISLHDPLEIFVDNGRILLKKYKDQCVLCGSDKICVEYHDKMVCSKCLDELKKLAVE